MSEHEIKKRSGRKTTSKKASKKVKVIKEVKKEKPEKVIPKYEFDAWYATRRKDIPAMHRKEILKAYFKAAGLTKEETFERYDAALLEYGVRLP